MRRSGATANIQVRGRVQKTAFFHDGGVGRRTDPASCGEIFPICDIFTCMGRKGGFIPRRQLSQLNLESGTVTSEQEVAKVL